MARKKNTTKFVAKKKQDSSIINFLALVSGMVTTLVVVMAVWSHFKAPAKIDRILADSTKNGSVESVNSGASSINAREFDEILERGTAAQLEMLLFQLDAWNRNATLSVQISENQKRVRVATQMLQLPLSVQQRDMAISSQISALSVIYGLDLQNELKIPDVGSNLLAAAKTHRSDPNPKIEQVARLAELKVEAFEYAKRIGQGSDPGDAEKRLTSLLQDYPDDDLVLSNIRLILVAIVNFDRDAGIKFMRQIAARSDEFNAGKTQAMLRSLYDSATLLECNYRQLFENRWIDGKSGQRELLKTSVSLLRDDQSGVDVIQSVGQVASWFEQDGQIDVALEIFQVMLESAADRNDAQASAMAKRLGQNGIGRANLIGQPIKFNAQTFMGASVDAVEVANRIVVIYFWSIDSPTSVTWLSQLATLATEMAGKKIAFWAVCVDPELGERHTTLTRGMNAFQFAYCPVDSAAGETLVEQCSVSESPHIVLVDHRGIVQNANASPEELRTTLQQLRVLQDKRK